MHPLWPEMSPACHRTTMAEFQFSQASGLMALGLRPALSRHLSLAMARWATGDVAWRPQSVQRQPPAGEARTKCGPHVLNSEGPRGLTVGPRPLSLSARSPPASRSRLPPCPVSGLAEPARMAASSTALWLRWTARSSATLRS